MTTKLLYNQTLNTFTPYEVVRPDGGPIVGLAPEVLIYDLEVSPAGQYDPATEYLEPFEIVNHDERRVTRGYMVLPIPQAEPEPDFNGFYADLLGSNVYQQTIVPTLRSGASPQLISFMSIFRFAIEDAMNGRIQPNQPANPNSLQSALWLLMEAAQSVLTADDLQELQTLMDLHNLSNTYVLVPPIP